MFEDLEIRPGVLVEVPVEIRDVTDLYAFDIELNFDPEYLEFDDADPNKDGIQPGFGTFLDPGMTLFNLIDSEEGLIRVVMSQINPSEPKSSSGNLLVLYLSGLKTGQTTLEVNKVELSTRFGEAIPVSGVDAEIRIASGAPIVTATSIPVIDPIEITAIPTLDPTLVPPTPTTAPSMTPLPTRTVTLTPQPTQVRTEAPAATVTSALTRTATLASTAAQSEAIADVDPEGEVDQAAPTEQPDTDAEGNGLEEEQNTDERLLAKDSPDSLGKLLPWLIGAAVLLITGIGIYIGKQRNRAISKEDK